MKRRRFLKAAAAASTFPLTSNTLAGCLPDPLPTDGGAPVWNLNPDEFDGGERSESFAEAVALDATIFAYGIAAGGMQAGSVLLWGHITGDISTRLKVWRETDDPAQVVVVHDLPVTPADDGTVKVTVDGLAPATDYRYGFFAAMDAAATATGRSEIGRLRTSWPASWRKPLTLGAITCTSWENRPYQALSNLAAEDLDLFVHLGDMSYNDAAFTYPEYQALWQQTLDDDGYRALLKSTGGYYAWDDHEFENNLNPETADPVRFADARRAFYAHVAAEEGEDGRLWRSYRWGETAEIFILDSRTERRPSRQADGVNAYLGEEQTAWLKSALVESPCHFKVLLNSVPVTLMPELWALAGDRWQGYPAAREELLDFLEDEDVSGVWFLSGDFHMGFVGRVETEGYRSRLWEVAVGPSGNLGNPLGLLAENPENRPFVFPAQQFLYGRGRIAGTTLTFDPDADEVRIRFIQARDGEVLFDDVVTSTT